MSDRFEAASGRRIVSRTSAEELGNLEHLVVDAKGLRVTALVVGKGRRALVVDWEHVSGFGPDAVMVADESALHPPRDDRERAAAGGKLELVGQRVLSDVGNDLGPITDVVFDPTSGVIEAFMIDDREVDAAALLGIGSFAVIVRASAE
jgi:uncharacterized protein YrrD